MRVVIFCHSLLSDWNHGNAHFLRGICSELIARQHQVCVYEPYHAWSLENLRRDAGDEPLAAFARAYPGLRSHQYRPESLDLRGVLESANLVLVHEWNDPALVAAVGDQRAGSGHFRLLFHDTHHRSVTDPDSMSRYDLRHYDGVLAFGASVAEVYLRNGWARNVWVWHEAADVRVFHPVDDHAPKLGDLVWIGNWGDDERSAELEEFLFEPVRTLDLKAKIYGVRYPDEARDALRRSGIEYGGWTPNFEAPRIFSRYRVTVHVPRRPYATALPGIPTIRIFEALACCIPLVSAPWSDSEGLFTPGKDFLTAADGDEMRHQLRSLLNNDSLAFRVAQRGLETIRSGHTCAHRVDELLQIAGEIQ